MGGNGLRGGVWVGKSACDREALVGEFGPDSELLEDQAVIKLSTVQMVRSRMVRKQGSTATNL
jgi:hypothetical protein